MSGRARRRALAVLAVVAVGAGLAALSTRSYFRSLEQRLATERIAAPLDVKNRLRAQLRGFLFVQPPADPAAQERLEADGRCADPPLGTRPVAAAAMPSTRLAPAEWLVPGRTLVSLWLDECRLRWLHRHRRSRGRRFEEIGWLSFFADGELRFASVAGVRMHGGTSRNRPPFNYRLYFRRAFGAENFPAGLLAPELDFDIEQLVLKRDLGRDRERRPWPLVESVSLDMGRRLGAATPAARPVALSLRGNPPLNYVLLERVDRRYLRQRYGRDDLELLPGKVSRRQKESATLAELAHWVQRQPAPLLAARAAERFDLPALTVSLLTALVTGAGDAFQDSLVRDPRREIAGGRWWLVLWDHDWAFRDGTHFSRFHGRGDLLPLLFDRKFRHERVPGLLLSRLLREDPAYRAEVARRLVAVFNHELTPEYFASLVDRHERIADDFALADRAFLTRLREHFERRPRELLRQAESHLGAAPVYPVTIAADTLRFAVDGREPTDRFRGWSGAAAPLDLEIVPDDLDRFAGWYDGERRLSTAPRLERGAEAPLTLLARARPAPAAAGGASPQRSRATG